MSIRECVESPLTQGADEQIAYVIDTTNWGGSPTSPTLKVYDTEDGSDVTTTCTTGTTSESGNDITTAKIKSLTAGHEYRVEVQYTYSGNTFELYFLVSAE